MKVGAFFFFVVATFSISYKLIHQIPLLMMAFPMLQENGNGGSFLFCKLLETVENRCCDFITRCKRYFLK